MNTKTLENKSGTIILPCRCPNVYQDIYYGHGMRVYNLKAKKETGKARCSSCGAIK